MNFDFSITFACYNQIEFTQLCIQSIQDSGYPLERVVVVDNNSRDETAAYLQTKPLGGLILNKANLGCGVAWNQGVLHFQSEWSIVMNNDIVVSKGWIEGMLVRAEELGLKLVCPAMVDGPNDYDFQTFSQMATAKMGNVSRQNLKHAVCMAIHRDVWNETGYFRPEPKLLGYEDTLFFHAFDQTKFRGAIVGSSWIHHFGSVTQKAMKKEKGLSERDDLGYRWNSKLLNMPWYERKWRKFQKKQLLGQFRRSEIENYGMTLHGTRVEGSFNWR